MKFSIKYLFSEFDYIRRKLRISVTVTEETLTKKHFLCNVKRIQCSRLFKDFSLELEGIVSGLH